MTKVSYPGNQHNNHNDQECQVKVNLMNKSTYVSLVTFVDK